MQRTTSIFFPRQFSGKALALYGFLALAALPFTSLAHDFWVEPEKFHASPGEQVPLKLYVGQYFKGESVLYAPESFDRYVYVGPSGAERTVPGQLGDDPAGKVPTKEPGLYIVGFQSKKYDLSFDSFAKVQEYLETEGLEKNLEVSRKRFAARKSIGEVYSRYAKSLVKVGDGKGADRALGFPLELIAQTNPFSGARSVTVQLLYRGKPIEGVLAVASNKQTATEKTRIRTDKDGRATFELKKPGVWLIQAVHMIPTGLLSQADWESFWASLTFEIL
jgi:uncharacterized GH25 family protein